MFITLPPSVPVPSQELLEGHIRRYREVAKNFVIVVGIQTVLAVMDILHTQLQNK